MTSKPVFRFLSIWISIAICGLPVVHGADSLEGLLLGKHAKSSKPPGRQPSSDGADSIKSFTQDDAEFSRGAKAIANTKAEPLPQGSGGAQIYQSYSRAVVLVITKDSIGSGVLIDSTGKIVTNWHVTGSNQDVRVVFKPATEGQSLSKNDLFQAQVLKVDQVADLALIHVARIPAGIKPLPMGNISDVMVGADVHAIGHPTGQAWTYTKGVVSQVRQAHNWSTSGSLIQHRANVIQTQTPINPGSSGGPLISDTGQLVGINTMFHAGGQGINFAVSVDEVRRFLGSAGNRYASGSNERPQKAAKRECKVKELYRHPSKDESKEIRGFDTDCDGKAELELHTPYDVRKPISVVFDENKDGHPDQMIIDTDRDEKWDYSLHDTNFDGKWDLVGFHPDGNIKPSRYEPYRGKSSP
jgi:S1-C subfamily serine protease